MNDEVRLMGNDIVDGLINYLYYPDRMRWGWPDIKEWILKEEYDRRVRLPLAGYKLNSVGTIVFPTQGVRGQKSKKKKGKSKR
jgi:hypothetical protein